MDKLTGTSYRECKTQNRFRTTAFARVYNAAKYCTRARTTHCTKRSSDVKNTELQANNNQQLLYFPTDVNIYNINRALVKHITTSVGRKPVNHNYIMTRHIIEDCSKTHLENDQEK
ncbi:hypothetical protein QTP88_022046 [Uroleucon formosanum]